LTSRTFLGAGGDQRPNREFSERHAGDQRFSRERTRIGQSRQENDCAGVKNSYRADGHGWASRSSSMSRRRRCGSMAGIRRQRASSASAPSGVRPAGRSSATGRPALVMVTCSPAATRSTTSPPWLRSSRMDTSLMSHNVSFMRQRAPPGGWGDLSDVRDVADPHQAIITMASSLGRPARSRPSSCTCAAECAAGRCRRVRAMVWCPRGDSTPPYMDRDRGVHAHSVVPRSRAAAARRSRSSAGTRALISGEWVPGPVSGGRPTPALAESPPRYPGRGALSCVGPACP